MSDFDSIKTKYEELLSLPVNSDGVAKRQRGYAFERLLFDLFTVDSLEPRASYRPEGEQIDGSIYLDGRVYLIEAKWHADPLPASTLYQFKGKVDGKLTGTIGVFISMSGYADDSVDALIQGKDLNIILVDRHDIDTAIVHGKGFKRVLKMKLRKASEEGVVYFPVEGELVTASKTSAIHIDSLRSYRTTDLTLMCQLAQTELPAVSDLLIVCEGESDRVVIAVLVKRILAEAGSDRSVKIMTALGKLTIPRVANALRDMFSEQSQMLIVVDGDNDPLGTEEMLSRGMEFENWSVSIPNPSIETWLSLDPETFRGRRRRSRVELNREAAYQVDIKALRLRDNEFDRFYRAVLGK
ncbi:restriction endonuclease [Burkholderia cenocepacia]|uniref:Restriction endonuclease type IV Mrr domain-containing protein n=1 Tax=Burkholderia cenocepacia TaxID=95486 RepID=A0AAD0NDP8_9BURK|nr:restriction endonuclease [Burkholderia cenocepacia]AWG32168.1 hypothetical protein B9Z07_25870 [Burkholderia cenocepacia]PRE33343.1 hypothetical protein C6P63_29055 [Burkholderia cenocepacia]HEM7886244.1 restriction endonuclease [Burkholderia cenocepacia]